MANLSVTGVIEEIFEAQEISERFRKREFIVEYGDNPEYLEHVKFEFIQDKCELLDNYHVGQEVEVLFNLKGRPWVSKRTGQTNYFNTLQAWSIRRSKAEKEKEVMAEPEPVWAGSEDDDLPF